MLLLEILFHCNGNSIRFVNSMHLMSSSRGRSLTSSRGLSLSSGGRPLTSSSRGRRPWRSMTSCLHGLPRFARNDSLSPSQGPHSSSSQGLSLSSRGRSLTSSRGLSLSSSRGRRPWRSMTSCLHGLPRFARNDSLSPSQGPHSSSSRGLSLSSSRGLSLSSSRGRRPWRSMTSCLHGLPRFARNDGEGSSRWPGHISV